MNDVSHLLTPPDDWQWGEFHNSNKHHIRYGHNAPKNAKALIIFAAGRTEIIEEYFETIRHFNALGYATAIMDWQGQGMSYRLTGDSSRHHSIGFERDISDFTEFLGQLDNGGLPKILIAHSMGANITLRYMADNLDMFKCGVMIAPMLGLNPKRFIKYMGKAILGLANRFGAMDKYALGQGAWNERFANIAKFKVSSDLVRRDLQPYLFKTRPELRCGGVTFGWVAEALKSISILQGGTLLSKITPPLLFATAGRDTVVDNQGTHRVIEGLPNAKHKEYPKSEHQIHREKDDIRLKLLRDIEGFIKKTL